MELIDGRDEILRRVCERYGLARTCPDLITRFTNIQDDMEADYRQARRGSGRNAY